MKTSSTLGGAGASIVLSAVLLSGCGTSRSDSAHAAQVASETSVSSTATVPATEISVPGNELLTTSLSSPEAGAYLSPPNVSSAAVSEAQAQKTVEAISGPLNASFTPKLALYTNTTYGTIGSNQSVQPSYTNVLVWAFVSHTPYSPGNGGAMVGPNGQPMTATLPSGTMCDGVWLVDATSGKYMMGYSDCPVSRS